MAACDTVVRLKRIYVYVGSIWMSTENGIASAHFNSSSGIGPSIHGGSKFAVKSQPGGRQ